MKKTFLIILTDDDFSDIACGNCGSILYGYDEEICPSCGAFVNMEKEVKMTMKEVDEIHEKYFN